MTRLAAISVVLTAIVLPAREAVHAEEHAQIRINSPFAVSVYRTDVDKEGQLAVTSSADKSFTVWPIDDPSDHQIERVPITHDQPKRASAIAISPDGKLIAYSTPPLVDGDGKFTKIRATVYVMERLAKGGRKIVKVLNGVNDDVVSRPQGLKFSRDGKFLAAALSSACGLRVWSTENWTSVYRDDLGYGNRDRTRQGEDECCRGDDPSVCDKLPNTNTVIFSSERQSESLIITSGDTGVRSYTITRNGMIERRAFAPPESIELEKPAGIALNRMQDTLAVGDQRFRAYDARVTYAPINFRVAIIDPLTLKALRKPLTISALDVIDKDFLIRHAGTENIAEQSSLDRVAWIENERGSFLIAAGAFPCHIVRPELLHSKLLHNKSVSKQQICISSWHMRSESDRPRFVPFGSDRVMDIVTVPNSGGIVALSQRIIAHIDEMGQPVLRRGALRFYEENGFADLRDLPKLDFKVSPDGKVVEFEAYPGITGETARITFDLQRRTMAVREGDSGGEATTDPDQDPGGDVIQNWRNQSKNPPLVRGKNPTGFSYGKDELFRSVTLIRGSSWLLLGSSEALRVIDYRGGTPTVICEQRFREEVYRVNVTENGSIAVSGHSDGTLRWHRIQHAESGCRLVPLLAAFIRKGTDGKWTATAWIPSGHRRGTFSSDIAIDPLLRWQCTVSDHEVMITSLHKQAKLIDPEAIFTALDERVGESEGIGDLSKSGDECAADNPLTLIPDRAAKLSIERPRETEVGTTKIKLEIWLDPDVTWPKRLTIKTDIDEPVSFTLNGAQYPSRAGAQIRPDMANPKTGLLELFIDLPKSIRRSRGQFSALNFYIDGEYQTYKKIVWVGDEPREKRKRRLWAVIIGISKHDAGPAMTLRFAENDALDIARLLIEDYMQRVVARTSIPPDFDDVHINLIISPISKEGADEIERLVADHSFVEKYEPSVRGVNSALLSVEQAINRSDGFEDVFLFHFSGHGMTASYADGWDSFFATQTTSDQTSTSLWDTMMSSSDLLRRFQQIQAQKIIILDACRTIPSNLGAKPFISERFQRQLESSNVDASIFFGSEVGNPSLELEDISFNPSRNKERRGNSLFTYAFLKALSTRPAGVALKESYVINITRLADYLINDFFNIDRPQSQINALMPFIEKKQRFPPKPHIILARSLKPGEIIRTLAPEH